MITNEIHSFYSKTFQALVQENAIELEQEENEEVEEYVQITENTCEHTSRPIMNQPAKLTNRFHKRTRTQLSKSSMNRSLSSSSEDERRPTTKLRTIRKTNEYHSTTVSSVLAEQKSFLNDRSKRSLSVLMYSSTTSIDSIENESVRSVSNTITFSHLSGQRTAKSVPIRRQEPLMKRSELTRTFAFDRACMEKYCSHSDMNEDTNSCRVNSVDETVQTDRIAPTLLHDMTTK